MPKKPKTLRHALPDGLRRSGESMWSSIVSKYELRPDELHRLEAACRVADMIQMLEDTWRDLGYPMVSVGSMKQEVIHPLIGEIRTQRSSLASLLAGLKLPDLDGGAETNQNRDAANSSWQPGVRGRGA